MSSLVPQRERFKVDGNKLIITACFDPRYQHGAESELLSTLQGILEESKGGSVILDLHLRQSMPSMLFGIIAASHQRVSEAGGILVLRILPEHQKSVDLTGMRRIFEEGQRKTDGDGIEYVEYRSKGVSDKDEG